MARDAELDRLKVLRDKAFSKKQDAFKRQQSAWGKLSNARDNMNSAFRSKQHAQGEFNQSWEDYQDVKNRNSSHIDYLNQDQERAFHNMKNAFDRASAAYSSGDKASAASYASEGHRYKEECQNIVNERRSLISEIQSARGKHEALKPRFHRLKHEFILAKDEFEGAKLDHQRARDEFQQAKEYFDSCAKEFADRLEVVKSDNRKRHENKSSIAERAGVPIEYRDDVRIVRGGNGETNIYFGGIGSPDGHGHGHYVLDSDGNLTYKRDPHKDHGSHNFIDKDKDKGATIYDRQARSGNVPVGGKGIFARRDGGREHVTQYYSDGYRLSSDIVDGKNTKRHWTNQNIKKKKPKRHIPPSDAN